MSVESVKKKAVELLKKCNPQKLASDVGNSEVLIELKAFSTVKARKQEVLFKPIVSGKRRGSFSCAESAENVEIFGNKLRFFAG